MDPLCELMDKIDKVHIIGNGTDLTFSIKGLPAVKCAGKCNIPDGEIYTAPVKNSINGVLRYNTPTVENGFTFTDVELNADYRTALAWAVEKGIAEGFTPTIFGGHATLSRQQLAVMLGRYAGEPERTGALDRFSDGAEAAAWAEPALAWAVETGVLKGFPDGTLRPADQVSRGELAAVLTRITEE